jgi:hypothetical protein
MQSFEEFLQLAAKAKEREDAAIGADEFEPEFVEVLKFVRDHSEIRPQVVAEFSRILKDRTYGHYTLIQFCMHELRWPEMKAEAQKIHATFQNEVAQKKLYRSPLQHVSYLEDVLSSFESTWDSKELFKYYES